MKQIITHKSILLISILFIFVGSNLSAQSEKIDLSTAIQKAMKNNYGIIISKADAKIAEINNSWANAGRYPSIGFSLTSSNTYNYYSEESFSSRLNPGIGLNWTLFNGFKVRLTKEKLNQLEELSKGMSSIIVEETIQETILKYYQVLLQKERLEVLGKVMKLSEDRYNLALNRHELGGAVSSEVLQSKNLFLNDKSLYLNQQIILRNSIRNLNFIMGESSDKLYVFTENLKHQKKEYKVKDLLDKSFSNNSLLKNQYINLKLEQNNYRLSQSSYFPKLSLNAGLGSQFSHLNTFDTDPQNTSNLNSYGNISLSYDIYTAGARSRALKISEINKEVAEVEVQEMKHSLTNQVMNSLDAYNVRNEMHTIAIESLKAAELNLEIAEEKFKSGAISIFNYRDIQLLYLNSSFKKLESIYNLIESNAQLTRLTGGFIMTESN